MIYRLQVLSRPISRAFQIKNCLDMSVATAQRAGRLQKMLPKRYSMKEAVDTSSILPRQFRLRKEGEIMSQSQWVEEARARKLIPLQRLNCFSHETIFLKRMNMPARMLA